MQSLYPCCHKGGSICNKSRASENFAHAENHECSSLYAWMNAVSMAIPFCPFWRFQLPEVLTLTVPYAYECCTAWAGKRHSSPAKGYKFGCVCSWIRVILTYSNGTVQIRLSLELGVKTSCNDFFTILMIWGFRTIEAGCQSRSTYSRRGSRLCGVLPRAAPSVPGEENLEKKVQPHRPPKDRVNEGMHRPWLPFRFKDTSTPPPKSQRPGIDLSVEPQTSLEQKSTHKKRQLQSSKRKCNLKNYKQGTQISKMLHLANWNVCCAANGGLSDEGLRKSEGIWWKRRLSCIFWRRLISANLQEGGQTPLKPPFITPPFAAAQRWTVQTY